MMLKILGIHDGFKGHENQVLGVINYLQKDVRFKDCTFSCKASKKNVFSCLPNMVNKVVSILDKSSKDEINTEFKNGESPDVIIGVGRRSFATAYYYQKMANKHDKKLHIIYLMPPCKYSHMVFDLIFYHSHKKAIDANNVKAILLPPHNVDMNAEATNFLSKGEKPIVSVIIGGSAKAIELTSASVSDLSSALHDIKAKNDVDIFVTTSPRTGLENEIMIKENLQNIATVLGYYDEKINGNPYLEMMQKSDFLIVTGESSSMLSEAISSKAKALYIFFSDNFKAQRYIKLHENLYQTNLAKPLESFNIEEKTEKFDVKHIIANNIYNILRG